MMEFICLFWFWFMLVWSFCWGFFSISLVDFFCFGNVADWAYAGWKFASRFWSHYVPQRVSVMKCFLPIIHLIDFQLLLFSFLFLVVECIVWFSYKVLSIDDENIFSCRMHSLICLTWYEIMSIPESNFLFSYLALY